MNYLLSFAFFLFFQANPDWHFNYQEAQKVASDEHKTVLLVFSGSDWCKPCIQLHNELFEKQEFIKYADEHLVLLKADFPYKKANRLSKEQTAHNEELAERYNPNGEFPLALFINSEGEILGTFGFDKTKSPVDYISSFKQILP